MNLKPVVSVVIPTFNRGHIIKDTIKSVLNQTYQNFEIIIVDDASTDNTEDVIKDIDSRIKYIKLERNSKGTKPRNVGIKLSRGDFIAFLDSDDEWLPEKLEKQLDFISKYNISDVMCFTGVIIRDERSEVFYKNKPLRNNEDIMDYILVRNNEVQTSTYMVSSSLAKNTLFNSELRKHQDWDFCLRLRNNNASFLFLPEFLTIWKNEMENNRISQNPKNANVSIKWLDSNKDYLSVKSQWAFKVRIIVNYLIEEKKKKDAVKIIFNAFFNNAIQFKLLLIKLADIFISGKLLKEIKFNVKKWIR